MKCQECNSDMSCQEVTIHLTDKDGLPFDVKLAHFTCNNPDCCEFNKPTPMDKYTKKPLTEINAHTHRKAVKTCE